MSEILYSSNDVFVDELMYDAEPHRLDIKDVIEVIQWMRSDPILVLPSWMMIIIIICRSVDKKNKTMNEGYETCDRLIVVDDAHPTEWIHNKWVTTTNTFTHTHTH